MQEVWLRPGSRKGPHQSRSRWVGLGKRDLQSLHYTFLLTVAQYITTLPLFQPFVSVGELLNQDDFAWLLSSL
jgi:hypothetical protein